MKRYRSHLVILLIMLLTMSAAFAAQSGTVRVLLTRLGQVEELRFSADCAYALTAGDVRMNIPAGAAITVSAGGSGLHIAYGKHGFDVGAEAEFLRCADGAAGIAFAAPKLENRYCGDLMLRAENGRITPVLHIYIEDYLYGVVGSNDAAKEAAKAEAVALRTDVFRLMQKNGSAAYDLTDAADGLEYAGRKAGVTTRAVDETHGSILYAGNVPAECFICESNGGQTESAKNALGRALSYAVVRDDPYDLENADAKRASCLLRRDLAGLNGELTAALKSGMRGDLESWGMDADAVTLRTLKSVTPIAPRFGEPSRVFTCLRFQLSVQAPGTNSGKPVSADVTVDVPVHGGLEKWYGLSLNDGDNETVEVTESDGGFTVTLRRDGSGVGLSRCGAQVMASAHGMSCSDILEFYYPGTVVKTLDLNYRGAHEPVEESAPEAQGAAGGFALPTLEPVATPTPAPTQEPTPTPTPTATATPTVEPTSEPMAEDGITIDFLDGTPEPTPTPTPYAPLFAGLGDVSNGGEADEAEDGEIIEEDDADIFGDDDFDDELDESFGGFDDIDLSDLDGEAEFDLPEGFGDEEDFPFVDEDVDDDEDIFGDDDEDEAGEDAAEEKAEDAPKNSDPDELDMPSGFDGFDDELSTEDDGGFEAEVEAERKKGTDTKKKKKNSGNEDELDMPSGFDGFDDELSTEDDGGFEAEVEAEGKKTKKKNKKKKKKSSGNEDEVDLPSGFDEDAFADMTGDAFTSDDDFPDEVSIAGISGSDIFSDGVIKDGDASKMKAPKSKVTAYALVESGSTLTLREKPSTSAEAIGCLARGEAVRVLKYNADWAYVQTSSGEKGYAARAYLSLDPVGDDENAADDEAEVFEGLSGVETNARFGSFAARTVKNANMRKNCSMQAEVLGTVPQGSLVVVYAYNETWVYCNYKGHEGFIKKELLKAVSRSD